MIDTLQSQVTDGDNVCQVLTVSHAIQKNRQIQTEREAIGEKLSSCLQELSQVNEKKMMIYDQLLSTQESLTDKEKHLQEKEVQLLAVQELNSSLKLEKEVAVSTLEKEISQLKQQLTNEISEKEEIRTQKTMEIVDLKQKFSSTLANELDNQRQMYESQIASVSNKLLEVETEKKEWQQKVEELSKKIHVDPAEEKSDADRILSDDDSFSKMTTKNTTITPPVLRKSSKRTNVNPKTETRKTPTRVEKSNESPKFQPKATGGTYRGKSKPIPTPKKKQVDLDLFEEVFSFR
eukprot:TRINITY_DN12466_c0_g1_i13.p1 TRINITY_DN12466_c0_g1~~TRINITY_DN12466_c0_g1_i13.p1  ORF type:complete len:292 (-),score=86.32 TRINITY_DN12466_c0_g1_i13:32-907(-)